MTTTPSPELPDLDRLEALARAATPGPWSWWTSNSVLRLSAADGIDGGVLHAYSHRGHADICCGESDRGYIAAANPAAVLALIALARRAQPEGKPTAWLATDLDGRGDVAFTREEAARRAGHGCTEFFPLFDGADASSTQPEGEAPQAEPFMYAISTSDGRAHFDEHCVDTTAEALVAEAEFATLASGEQYRVVPVYIAAPAAQHAERGASDLDAFGAWKSYPLPGLNSDGHFDKDWLHREFVALEAGRRAALAAQQAAAPGSLALLNAEEMAALHRFQETCQDFDSGGYDVDKNMMKRLAAIGVIESKGFNRYQFTEFGDYVVEHYAPNAPGTPEALTLDDQLADATSALRKIAENGGEAGKTARAALHVIAAIHRRAAQLDGGQGEGA